MEIVILRTHLSENVSMWRGPKRTFDPEFRMLDYNQQALFKAECMAACAPFICSSFCQPASHNHKLVTRVKWSFDRQRSPDPQFENHCYRWMPVSCGSSIKFEAMPTTFSTHSLSSGTIQGPSGRRLLALGRSQAVPSIHRAIGDMAGLSYGDGHPLTDTNILDTNEKGTMKNLNDRLAAYLDKVLSLEKSNMQLEQNIQEFYTKQASAGIHDMSPYFNAITQLKSEIQEETLKKAGLLLQIENARLASDDFRVKLESEVAMRLSLEGDLGGLRKALEEFNASRTSLQVQAENLQDELDCLKRNHKEEMAPLQGHLGGTVNVEVDSMPGTDLQKILNEIRDQYEGVMEKNRQEAEALHQSQCDALNQEVSVSTEALHSAQMKMVELKRLVQALEIELQSLWSMKGVLEGTLAEVQSHYGLELSQLRNLVATREAELLQLKSDAQKQVEDYKRLVDIKNRLEQEIATYHCLLEGSEPPTSPVPCVTPCRTLGKPTGEDRH
ncbi:keratin, type I cytoskeletal 19-like isoform X2 [Erythrolamprus reginae]|uniref:keratin, type I cytoskeletal 19-like isoform X2 n=1 Tax=Erythrolamprus reginae TaxID=121349 RepID=UPI00396CEDC2